MDVERTAAGPGVITVSGWSFGVQVRGHGPPIVLLHGLLTDSRVWEPLAADLERNHTVVTIDAPGHGLSPAVDRDFTLEEEVSGLAKVADMVTADPPAVWVGHSMGGMKALRMALGHPGLVSALVLISTQPYKEPEPSRRHYEAMVEAVKAFGMSADLAEVIAKLNFHRRYLETDGARRWVEHFQTLTGEQIEHPCHAVYRRRDISAELGLINVPALVIHGLDDVPIRVRVARRYTDLLPRGRLIELAATGHTPPCERPEELTGIVRDFVGSYARDYARDGNDHGSGQQGTRKTQAGRRIQIGPRPS